MQLSVFSTDNQKSGFRLQYMEVFNWGTFDETIHAIRPMGETSLLTGANGSGKTTFVDALLTLIVPEKKYRFYNQSSGSEKKGDRTEDTYVLGEFGDINGESGAPAKTLYLRESKDEAYSILLAHFANEAEQFVTLFQVRWFIKGEMKRWYGVAHKPLHIEEDFKPFDLGGNWKRVLEQRYNKGTRKQIEWFDTPGKYAQRLVDVLGMQSMQALHLFNQTVGIKVLGNLDEFIRAHMLEPKDTEQQFTELKEHLSTLLNARLDIEKAEDQVKLLQPLEKHYNDFNSLQQEINAINTELETATVWKSFSLHRLVEEAAVNKAAELKLIAEKIVAFKQEAEKLLEEEMSVRSLIDQNKAGQRLLELEKQIADLTIKKQQAEKGLDEFIHWCTTLHLSENTPADEQSYQRIKKENHTKFLDLERQIRINGDDAYDAKREMDAAVKEKEIVEAELNAMLANKSNIDFHLMDLRKRICEYLQLATDELPFAGELMQLKQEELAWQPALEKLLRPFALRMLVPDKHYKKVNKFVNNNNLRARLVYERVTDIALEEHPEKDMVSEKLEFNHDHKLSGWVEQLLIRQYNYVCIDDGKNNGPL